MPEALFDDVAAKKKLESVEMEEEELVMVVGGRTSRSQVGGGCRRVTPTTTAGEFIAIPSSAVVVEKVLPNGDVYAGGFVSNVPHGVGKYLWRDGCMYEGEWRKGKACGKGKFSWPSGATYVGEFRSGRMEGFGTLIGAERDTYRGSWVGDRKQGYGQKRYVNGDYYEGTWRKNVQDGKGKYVWRNGNEYSGEWRNGVISGRGTLVWANGDRYEGVWENGVPKGSNGVFSVGDGGEGRRLCVEGGKEVRLSEVCYEGVGGRGSGLRKRSSVDGPRGSLTEKPFPRICIWESEGEAGDITCDIIDNVEASMFYQDGSSVDVVMDGMKRLEPARSFLTTEVKKPGQTIAKGHKNYDLMLNLQLGIRYL